MDPVTIVVSALVAGLITGTTEMAKTAVIDIYESLKKSLSNKTEGNDDARAALVAIEKKPESEARQNVLKEELAKLNLEKDAELIQLAKSILEHLDHAGAQAGKYNITIQNAQGVVIGDRNKIKQSFTSKSEKQ